MQMQVNAKDFLVYHMCTRKLFREVLKPEKTTINTFEVLLTIKENPSLNVGQIGQLINISRPNTTPLVDKLVKDGFVEKETNQDDLRSFTLKITKSGEKELTKIFNLINERLDEYLTIFEKEEQKKLNQIITETNQLFNIK